MKHELILRLSYTKKYQIVIYDIYLISAPKHRFGYLLVPHQIGGSKGYSQSI